MSGVGMCRATFWRCTKTFLFFCDKCLNVPEMFPKSPEIDDVSMPLCNTQQDTQKKGGKGERKRRTQASKLKRQETARLEAAERMKADRLKEKIVSQTV